MPPNAALTLFVRSRARDAAYNEAMPAPFIHGRRALADAADLIDRFGDEAALHASGLAASSRDAGNVIRFCHWRQIERLIAALASTEIADTVH